MINQLKEADTIGSVLKLAMDKAQCLTLWRDGGFDAYFDDLENDTRTVVNYRGGKQYFKVTCLHGYNAEKHIWTKDGARGEVELGSKRGFKAINDTYKAMAFKLRGHLPEMLAMYRKDGEWGL